MKLLSAFFAAALAATPLVSASQPSSGSDSSPVAATAEATLPEFNKAVLRLIAEYPTDGTHRYWWPRAGESSYDGVTRDFELCGTTVLRGEEEGRTFCCGLTLEVFLRAYQEELARHGVAEADGPLQPDTFPAFRRAWFVEALNGPGPSLALERAGLGRQITEEEVLPGDMVQIWRHPRQGQANPSGHSVVFLDWARDEEGNRTGIRYWSTQPSTNGIGEATEYFAPEGAQGVAREFTFYARVDWSIAAE